MVGFCPFSWVGFSHKPSPMSYVSSLQCQASIGYVFRTGEIIAQYPDDTPFPSCLILGYSGERALHVVASIDEELVYIITAYAPSPAKWEADWKTRKEETK